MAAADNSNKCGTEFDQNFRQLLVAVDGSDQSEYAVQTAARFAQMTHADVMIVHVYWPPPMTELRPGFVDIEPRRVHLEKGEKLLARAKSQMPASCRVAVDLREGDAAAEILKATHRFEADLIVMGTHARGRLAQAVLGSVTRAVTQGANCPVLTVAHPPRELEFRMKGTVAAAV